MLADRKAEARAAIAPRDRGVALAELPEQYGADFLAHADAGVAYREVQTGDAVVRRRDLQDDAPTLGELYGVSHEVEKNLAQAVGIAAIMSAGARIDLEPEDNALLRAPLAP